MPRKRNRPLDGKTYEMSGLSRLVETGQADPLCRIHDVGIKLAATLATKLDDRFIRLMGGSVGAVGGHGDESVSDAQDPSTQGWLKSMRIVGFVSIEACVVMMDHGSDRVVCAHL